MYAKATTLIVYFSPENRFTPIYDFGYVAMNFGWVYPEDSGEYVCRATNLYGSDETRGFINTAGRPGIIYESQLPKGMASIERIREMESGWQRAPGTVSSSILVGHHRPLLS